MKVLYIIPALLLLASCSGATNLSKSEMTLPPLISYDRDFRDSFADELDTICGRNAYPKTCIFVQDSLELRSRIKELKD